MTALPLDRADYATIVQSHSPIAKYVVEALGTFGLLSTLGVAVSTANPFAALGIGAVLMGVIYAGFQSTGAHFNPAITAAALWWGRITLRQAVGYWCAQFVAGVGAALAVRAVLGASQADGATAMMLSGGVLVAALAAELLFTFVLGYVAFRCANSGNCAPNTLAALAIGVAVLASVVDGSALFGDVFLVSQLIVGAFAGIAFLTLGSAGR